MAATIAKAIGSDSSRVKETHRLGSQSAKAEANTWRTFATAFVRRNGSGYVTVERDGNTIGTIEFGPEDESPRMAALSLQRNAAALTRDASNAMLAVAAVPGWADED